MLNNLVKVKGKAAKKKRARMSEKITISFKISVRYVAVAVRKPETRSETTCKKKAR